MQEAVSRNRAALAGLSCTIDPEKPAGQWDRRQLSAPIQLMKSRGRIFRHKKSPRPEPGAWVASLC